MSEQGEAPRKLTRQECRHAERVDAITTVQTLVLRRRVLGILATIGMLLNCARHPLAGGVFAAETATYAFPLRAQRAASYPSCHHDYPASDIFVPTGSRFVAPTSGVVDFVSRTDDWDPTVDDPSTRGALAVAIVGDDGVRYYGSHLSRVAAGMRPGVRVVTGQRLGRTGQSGNARGTDPHLHFGISRPTTPDDWAVRRGEVNPYPYLNAWRDGSDQTPDLAEPGGGVCA
jgi:murein DD-endopeptidase MepM/ murein hydrolase activator NlpD